MGQDVSNLNVKKRQIIDIIVTSSHQRIRTDAWPKHQRFFQSETPDTWWLKFLVIANSTLFFMVLSGASLLICRAIVIDSHPWKFRCYDLNSSCSFCQHLDPQFWVWYFSREKNTNKNNYRWLKFHIQACRNLGNLGTFLPHQGLIRW